MKFLPVLAPSVIALAVASGIAYAQTGSTKSNSALTTEIGSNLPDNTTGLITPFTLRQTVLDMLNSTPIACVTKVTPSTYTLLTSDYGCIVSFNSAAAVTATLGTPSVFNPFIATINNIGAGAINIAPVSGQINSATVVTLSGSGGGAIVFSDGSNYRAFQSGGGGGSGGGSTPPGGSNTQVQYNNSGNFGGISSVTSDGASIFALTSTIASLTSTTARVVGWLTASGANFQTGSFAGNLTGSTAQFSGLLTGTNATFQTVTISSLTPGGPNCLQETGGVVQATNAACTTATNTGIAAGTNITTSGSAGNVTVNTVLTPSFTTVISTGTGTLGGITGSLAAITTWLTAAGVNVFTETIANNLTGSTANFSSNLTANIAQFAGFMSAGGGSLSGLTIQTGTFSGNLTGTSANFSSNLTATSAQFTGQVTGTSAVFQTVTINNLTPTGPNCIQETGGVLQATNAACGSGSGVTGGAAGAVALWNSTTVLTNDIGITFTSPGQLALNLQNISATTAFNTNPRAISIVGTWNSSGATFDAPLFMNITNSSSASGSKVFDFQVGGSTLYGMGLNQGFAVVGGVGSNWVYLGTPGSVGNIVYKGTQFVLGTTALIQWFSNADPLSGAAQFSLGDNGNNLQIGNNSTATGLQVYNTTDNISGTPTNYERLAFDFTTSANTATIGTQANGTGVGRTVMFVASNTKAISISPTINFYGQSNPGANETYAVCAGSGATSLTAGGQVFVDTTTCLASSMLVKHDIAAFNDYGMTKLASLAEPIHAERRLATAPIEVDPITMAMALVPAVATYDTLGSGEPEFTLIAQNVCQVDERLCERTRTGEVRSFKPNAVISILVAAFQKQQAEIEELKRRLH